MESNPELHSSSIVTRYPDSIKFLLNYIDMMEKSDRFNTITIYSEDKKKLISDFKSLFRIKIAAGGFVKNDKDEALFIHRFGRWDLPKGGLFPDESKKEAAVREVIEETGVKNITLLKKIGKTRHIYRNRKGNRVLKYSYWYLMHSNDTDITPQTNEGIEKVEWIKPEELIARTNDTGKEEIYRAIFDFVVKSLNKR